MVYVRFAVTTMTICSSYENEKNKENGESEGKTILWASSGQTGAWTEILLEMK